MKKLTPFVSRVLLARILLVRILLAVVLLTITTVYVRATTKVAKRVLLISIDGLRPDFYLDDKFTAPTIKGLMADGAYAQSVAPVFPTLTYPNHTSLVTGLYTNKHGILSNTVYSSDKGPSPAWYWEAEHVKAKSLFDYVRSAGGKTAAVRWPVTLKAENVDYLVPEIFSMKGYYEGDGFELTAQYTDADLMEEILSATTEKSYKDEVEMDRWVAEATAYIWEKKAPDFMAIHLANVDHVEHGKGRDAGEVVEAVEEVDREIKTILSVVDLKNTCVVITGDHGFIDVSKSVNPNYLFIQKGWIKLNDKKAVTKWQVIAHASGAQAAIYVKDEELLDEVTKLLEKHADKAFSLISREKLDKLGAYPEAAFAIEGQPGYTVSGSVSQKELITNASIKGQHGFLPEHKQIHTGLVMAGCGYDAGTKWDEVQLVDIAPTIAKIMGLSDLEFDGQSL